MATIIATGSVMVQYDGKNIYPAGGSYTVVDSYDNYQKYLADVSAGIVSAGATAFNNNVDSSERYVYKDVDLSLAAARGTTSHRVFDVTGAVRMKMFVQCTTDCNGSANTTEIAFGPAGAGSAFIGGTSVDLLSAGEIWCTSGPPTYAGYASAVIEKVVISKAVGYTLINASTSNGGLTFHCWYTPMSPNGLVTAGNLSTLA